MNAENQNQAEAAPVRVRAKFKVTEITRRSYDHGKGGSVVLSPVYSTDPNHENKKFWDATPSGKIEMQINNPAGFQAFELGSEYYVDFTIAPAS